MKKFMTISLNNTYFKRKTRTFCHDFFVTMSDLKMKMTLVHADLLHQYEGLLGITMTKVNLHSFVSEST